MIQEHGINVLFTAATAMRAIRKADPGAALQRNYDVSSLRALFTAGEWLDTDTFHLASRSVGDGYVFVMGRTDDIINVAGHRLSTGAMEQVIGQHPAVAECAVIGLADPLKGQRPSGYVVLQSGVEVSGDVLAKDLVAMVRRDIGAVADFKHVTVVDALPKTRSGKILRKTMRQIAEGEDYTVPSTIEDAGVIDQLMGALRPGGRGD